MCMCKPIVGSANHIAQISCNKGYANSFRTYNLFAYSSGFHFMCSSFSFFASAFALAALRSSFIFCASALAAARISFLLSYK